MTAALAPIVNPFLGPRPFGVGDRLFGRDREVDELYYQLSAERIVLLHSPSGAGKSSLIQAGLVPRLQGRFDVWGPVRVNLPCTQTNVNRYVRSAVLGFEEQLPDHVRRNESSLEGISLGDYVAGRPRRRSAPAHTVIIFDQFEEILTADPLALDVKREFFRQLGSVLQDRGMFALLALREDYLAQLDPYATEVPTHLKPRYRLDLLSRDAAREAIAMPPAESGRPIATEAVEKLVLDLAATNVQQPDGTFVQRTGHHVEPLQLQVVCRGLWEKVAPSKATIDMDDVTRFGNVTGALASYYTTEVTRLAGRKKGIERNIRNWVGGKLITPDGIRTPVLKRAGRSDGLDNRYIDALVDSHLVRGEHRAGATWFELAHDRLVEPVRASNRDWFRVDNLRRGALRAIGAAMILMVVGMAVSYTRNSMLESELKALPVWSKTESGFWSEEALRALEPLRQQVEILRQWQHEGAPLSYRFGFYRGTRLLQESRGIFMDRMDELMLNRLRNRLLGDLRKLPAAPGPNDSFDTTYQTLRAYLMITSQPGRTDALLPQFLLALCCVGGTMTPSHLQLASSQLQTWAQFNLIAGSPVQRSDAQAVMMARRYLMQFSAVDRIYVSSLAGANRAGREAVFGRAPSAALQFIRIGGTVPHAFTKTGAQLISSALARGDLFGEQWVLLDADSAQNIDLQYLRKELQNRYDSDHQRVWTALLRSVELTPFASASDSIALVRRIVAKPNGELYRFFAEVSRVSEGAGVTQPASVVVSPAADPYWNAMERLADAADKGDVSRIRAAAREARAAAESLTRGFNPEIGRETLRIMLAPISGLERD